MLALGELPEYTSILYVRVNDVRGVVSSLNRSKNVLSESPVPPPPGRGLAIGAEQRWVC